MLRNTMIGLWYLFRWLLFMVFSWMHAPFLLLTRIIYLFCGLGGVLIMAIAPSETQKVYGLAITSFLLFVLGYAYDYFLYWLDPAFDKNRMEDDYDD